MSFYLDILIGIIAGAYFVRYIRRRRAEVAARAVSEEWLRTYGGDHEV